MAEQPRARSNLALRLLTAVPWVPALIYLLYFAPPWCFPVVAGVVCAFSAWELFGMIAPDHVLLRIWGAIASVGLFSLLGVPAASSFLPAGLIALSCVGMLVVLVSPHPLESAATRIGWALAGPLYMGGLFGAIVLLFRHERGGSWVMLALMCGWFSDTVAYFVGRRFGKHKLSAAVSPKKTIEGSAGGLAGGLFGGLLAHFWFLKQLPLLDAILLSLVATAVGQAGDLCESLIKRSVGVKDSGSILPGHGGFLDRTDAMLFSAAVICLYLAIRAPLAM